MEKGEIAHLSNFTFLYARRRRDLLRDHPWRAGGVPHSLSGAYLKDYASYGYDLIKAECSAQKPKFLLA